MSQNLHQVFENNPITSNAGTDLMYFSQSPYGVSDDAGMLFDDFAAQFANQTAGSFTGTILGALTGITTPVTYQIIGSVVTLKILNFFGTCGSSTFPILISGAPISLRPAQQAIGLINVSINGSNVISAFRVDSSNQVIDIYANISQGNFTIGNTIGLNSNFTAGNASTTLVYAL